MTLEINLKISLVGTRVGRLVVISKLKCGWLCQCDCGKEKAFYTSQLLGNARSCGCLSRERRTIEINIAQTTGLKNCTRERVRELIRIRDKHTCQSCGKKWIVGQRRFDIHHLDCIKEKTKQCDNYHAEKDNMITLCHKCHLNLPEHRLTMSTALRKSC